MQTIPISVPDNLYSVYQTVPNKEKIFIENAMANLLKTIFREEFTDKFNKSASQLRQEAIKNGLTDENLEKILKEIDDERTTELRF